jgi:alcohol dehydrogenase
VGLLVDDEADTELPMDRVVADELEIRGTHGIQAPRYPAIFDMIEAGSLAPKKLIRRTLPLSRAGTALMQMGGDSPAGVTVVTLSDDSVAESD